MTGVTMAPAEFFVETLMQCPPMDATQGRVCWRLAAEGLIMAYLWESRVHPRCAPTGPPVNVGVAQHCQRSKGDDAAMVTRLSASDASFYQLENTATPMYVGSLSILRRPRNGLSYDTLLATVEQRLAQIPRYRQKVREVTFG